MSVHAEELKVEPARAGKQWGGAGLSWVPEGKLVKSLSPGTAERGSWTSLLVETRSCKKPFPLCGICPGEIWDVGYGAGFILVLVY